MDERKIIQKIRELRKQKRFTLDDLADLTGFTKGYLSKIENSANLPPLSTLHRIASALGVVLSQILSEENTDPLENQIAFVRKNQRREMQVAIHGTQFKHWPLAHRKIGRNMDPYIIEIPPDNYQVYQHEGEEFYFILEGEIELNYGGESYRLEAGDSVYFDTHIPHSGRSVGEKPAQALTMFYSYKKINREPFTGGILPARNSKRPNE